MNSKMTSIASLWIVLAIILGAFGAHALKEMLSPEKLVSFETGVRYQMYMGLGMLMLSLNEKKFLFRMKWVYSLLTAGLFLFSFSIYLLALQEPLKMDLSFLGPVTPVGGVFLIMGWSIFSIQLIKTSKKSN